MRVIHPILILLLLSSCRSTPKKTAEISDLSTENKVVSAEAEAQTPVEINNINISFIQSQISSLDIQMIHIDGMLMGAQARLNHFKSSGMPGHEASIAGIKAEIFGLNSQKNTIQAQKQGLEMQLMLNQ